MTEELDEVQYIGNYFDIDDLIEAAEEHFPEDEWSLDMVHWTTGNTMAVAFHSIGVCGDDFHSPVEREYLWLEDGEPVKEKRLVKPRENLESWDLEKL